MTKISENITKLTVETKKGIVNLDFYGIYQNVSAKTLLTKYKKNITKVECIDFKYFYDMKKALSELNISLDDVKTFEFSNKNVVINLSGSSVDIGLYINGSDCMRYTEASEDMMFSTDKVDYKNFHAILSTLMLQPLTTNTEHKIYNTVNDMKQLIYQKMERC